ncbi:ATP-citrate synthase [Meloidogyne graminicola]|uniref:ATP-citrate synthase n=1 Tax=Meloidogyne graminicola TaxID=189291 RepID=A0A8S9ZM04_9BILA|nr:ATP-citrate synthase [Meloidogyne graminicola]
MTATKTGDGKSNEMTQKFIASIIWDKHGMMDFDYVCRRESPSVVASTYPFTGDHKQKVLFWTNELLVPLINQWLLLFVHIQMLQ